MIFTHEPRSVEHERMYARVKKWREQFKNKRERLKPQWEYEREWHPHFALLPVEVGNYENPRTAWLCWVERRLAEYARNEMPTIQASWDLRRFEYREKAK